MSLQDTNVVFEKMLEDIKSAMTIFLDNYGSVEEFCSNSVVPTSEEDYFDPENYIYIGVFVGGGMMIITLAMICCAWYCLPLIAAALCAAASAGDSDSGSGSDSGGKRGCGSGGSGSSLCGGGSGSGPCGSGGGCGESGCCNFDIDFPQCDCVSCPSCGSCMQCDSCGDCCNCCECCDCCNCCDCCDCERRKRKKKKQEEEEEDQQEDIILAGKLYYQENQNMSLNPYEI